MVQYIIYTFDIIPMLVNKMAYWLFQVDPRKYNIDCAIQRGDGLFTARSHQKRIKVDDNVLIYKIKVNQGIIATAKVMSSPTVCSDEDDDCWLSLYDRNYEECRVRLSYENLKKPIIAETLKNDSILKNMYFGKKGTNFTVTEEQWFKVQEYIKKGNI